MMLMAVAGIGLLSIAQTLATGMIAAALIGFSTGGEADITPYMISRYFGLKRFSTLYAFTHTAHAIGASIGPLIVGKIFDLRGSYPPATIQLLALPSFVACLVLFLLPRYNHRYATRQPALLESLIEVPATEIPQ
jgi:MFS family permease